MPQRKTRTSFKKGDRPSPTRRVRKSRPTWDRQELAAISIDNSMIKRYLNLNFHLTEKELKAKIKAGRCSSLEAAFIQILLRATAGGDHAKLDFLLDRLVGKVATKHEVSKPDPYEDKTLEELTQMKKDLLESNEQTLRNIERESAQLINAAREVTEIEHGEPSPTAGEPDQRDRAQPSDQS